MVKSAVVISALLWSPPTLSGQAINTLSGQDRAQGWELLFDGKTLTGWHVSAPAGAAAGAVRLSRRRLARWGHRSHVSRRGQNRRRRVALTGKSSTAS